MKLIKGDLLAEIVLEQAQKDLHEHALKPVLAIIFIGNDPGSQVYVKKKQEAGARIGVQVVLHRFESATTEDICALTRTLAGDPKVSGIILQLPASGIDLVQVFALIPPAKDVDGLNPLSLGKLWQGQEQLIPATPAAILFALEQVAQADKQSLPEMLTGKNVLVISRSLIIGKPLAALLLNMDATVTIAHAKTTGLAEFSSRADIIISGAGVPGLLKAADIKPGVVIIDAGFRKTADGIQGDIGQNDLSSKAAYISPVPNGIGPLGVAFLIANTVKAALLATY